ncbi:BamA/TamA family outer membrane protein [Gilvimarinus sp. DA14]|uniref:BamA/TamA family outer membrane protein n=1 Tax=Gilvimarinus sp. DA14 TaxID=2956798 RepID=UPI0020B78E70|nr:BamA/TamA family outer membrane protein [Gilvimarinus sp. DA14]UTF58949.1 BamA/TamA family outer membrane protein [Gilvimarinus sp. DA14]
MPYSPGTNLLRRLAMGVAFSMSTSLACAQTTGDASTEANKESPWLLVPKISSNPKIGTSVGGVGGYLFQLDKESTASMAALMANYSDTDSVTASGFFKGFWDGDSKRLIAGVAGGKIRNDYEDYLGTGQEVSTTDDMKFAFVRYLQEVHKNWFLGGQAVYTNYYIDGEGLLTNEIFSLLGLTGYTSGGVGLTAMYDSRDNQNSPLRGMNLNLSNIAYRENLGGDQDFDTYRLQFKHYLPVGAKSVFAYRAVGRWSDDAPTGAYSSVTLRGYTRGQYLAPNSVMAEGELRWNLTGKWGLHLFGGVSCLYGDDKSCGDSENIYTSGGVGGEYMLKPSQRMVVSADYAVGEGDNQGFYLRFGQAF